jgi:outer membrane protein
MKQSKKFILLLPILFLLFFTSLKAQKIWSLEDCIMYALENNITIQQQVLNTQYNDNLLRQSKINQLPNLNAGLNQNFLFGRSLDETTYRYTENQKTVTSNVNVASTVTLFQGLQQRHTIHQNEFNLLASLQDLEKLKNDISMFLASGYLQILFNMEILEVAEIQHETTLQQVERTAKLVEAGSLARGALLEIQAQAAGEELNVIEAQNALDISYLTLTQMLDLDSVGKFEIDIPEFGDVAREPIQLTVEEVFQDGLNVLPRIRSAELQVKSAEKGLSIAQGGRSPSLIMRGSYATGYSDARQLLIGLDPELNPMWQEYPFWDQMKDNRNVALTFGLNIPIFNKTMISTNISNAKLNVLNYELTLETSKMDLYKSIQQAYADATAARRAYLATETALVSMEESFKYTEEKYVVGLVNTVDYNIEKTRLANTQSDLVQAKYDYIFKVKVLDFYRGIPIRL